MLETSSNSKVVEMKEEILCDNPKVYTITNFISDEECEHMKKIAIPTLENSVVSDNKGGYVSQGRTSKTSWIKHDHDCITDIISQRISKQVQIPIINAERFQVVQYGINGEYRQHYDAWDHDGSEKAFRCIKYGGQRMVTALVYLNDVEEGGGTGFPRLKKEVKAEKGKLLVFQNVLNGTHNKHPLSEHAGLPVIKGEKYIFNLWFRECPRNILYSHFNPKYYENIPNGELTENQLKMIQNMSFDDLEKIHDTKNIFKYREILSNEECDNLIKSCFFSDERNSNVWINKSNQPLLIKKIEELTQIKSNFYENINVVKYQPKNIHGPFFDGYDLTTANGKKYTATLGQRFKTVSISLSNSIYYKFNKMNCEYEIDKGTMLYYYNIVNTRQRDDSMSHIVENKLDEPVYILNIYIRERDLQGNILFDENIKDQDTSVFNMENNVQLEIKEKENYTETYHQVLKMFENKEITRTWNSYKEFSYIFKGDFNNVTDYVLKFKNLVDEDKGLNKKLLEVEYNFDEYNPVNLNDTIHPELLQLLQTYYRTTITSGVFPLGDRQSNRYKANNEPISRFLHFEMLPLIEKITKQTLRPTYTYLSSYINKCDLPAHTDREDCEYTVSFLVNKDKDWPVYLHKVKQHKKHLGRTKERYLDKSECIELIGESGGFVIFCGCDHAHYREEYEGTFYDILLLHYRCV
jgi:prolyl 4-hydroxylase